MTSRDTCLCCGVDKGSLITSRYDKYNLSICKKCGFEHFLLNDDNAITISGEMYESDSDYQDDLALASDHQKMLQWHHQYALHFISKANFQSGFRVLDVGCHTGFFVKELVNRGFDAYGIDFNKKCIEFGKNFYDLNERISIKTLEEIKNTGKLFDIISLFEVIEHIQNPRQLLQALISLLKPTGILILSTPNKNMCWRPPLDYPPHHLSRFTPHAIKSLLSSLGLSIVDRSEQMSFFELSRNFFGTKFRSKSAKSFRGGEFKYHKISLWVRRFLNAVRPTTYSLFRPIDILLYRMGLRYIGQVIIAKK